MMNLEQIILTVPAILFAISVHELGHAFMAYKLGDPTPKYQGRLTLNPFAHLDILGTIMLLVFRFGWAKPVRINANYFKNRKQGTIFVSLAGPLANIISAWVFYNLMKFTALHLSGTSFTIALFIFFQISVQLNLGLAAFNLLPIPPLDGSHILQGFLPGRLEYKFSKLASYGPLLLIILLVTGGARFIMNPIYGALVKLVTALSF